jgi:hypothetical protein
MYHRPHTQKESRCAFCSGSLCSCLRLTPHAAWYSRTPVPVTAGSRVGRAIGMCPVRRSGYMSWPVRPGPPCPLAKPPGAHAGERAERRSRSASRVTPFSSFPSTHRCCVVLRSASSLPHHYPGIKALPSQPRHTRGRTPCTLPHRGDVSANTPRVEWWHLAHADIPRVWHPRRSR